VDPEKTAGPSRAARSLVAPRIGAVAQVAKEITTGVFGLRRSAHQTPLCTRGSSRLMKVPRDLSGEELARSLAGMVSHHRSSAPDQWIGGEKQHAPPVVPAASVAAAGYSLRRLRIGLRRAEHRPRSRLGPLHCLFLAPLGD
jgi:hypothetical protein